jgi:hypothetical protein
LAFAEFAVNPVNLQFTTPEIVVRHTPNAPIAHHLLPISAAICAHPEGTQDETSGG